MAEKQRPSVKVDKHRCPYCHDTPTPEESVACQGCLTRHHEACWNELGHCGSCEGEVRLQVERVPLTQESVARNLLAQGYGLSEVQALFAAPPATAPQAPRGVFMRAMAGLFGLLCVGAAAGGAGGLAFQIAIEGFGIDHGNAAGCGAAIGALVFGALGLTLLLVLRRK